MLCHKAWIQLLRVLADEILGQSLQQPGSLFGSLYSALQPIVSGYPSWTAASQALRQLRSSDGGRSTSHAAVQLQKQLQSLHLGQLLLRLDAQSLMGGSSALWNPKQPLAHDLLLCNTTQQSFWGHSSPSGSCSTGTSPQLVKCFASLELYHCASPTLSRPLHAYIERPRRMLPAAALQQGAQRARLWRPGWAVAGRPGPAMGRATSTARLSLRPGSAQSLCAVCPLWAR